MEPPLTIAALWALFSTTHIGLAVGPIRDRLVARMGERGFTVLFSSVASVCFAALVYGYARLRFEGAPGLALGAVPGVAPALGWIGAIGLVLMVASFATYSSSPMSASSNLRAPRGLERITRHPFFVGVALFAGAHALLASQLTGVVFFGALALHASLGAWHQDRKLLRRRGASYGEFLGVSSAFPFAAIAARRQSLALRELPWLALALGAGVAYGLRTVHESIFSYGGLWIIGLTVGGAAFALAGQWSSIPGAAQPATARSEG